MEVERAPRVRVDNFVSILSYELPTPMTILVGYSELLLKDEPRKNARREWCASMPMPNLFILT